MKPEAPLFDMLKKYAEKDCARFHMPGHKGRGEMDCFKYDITELSFSDNLYAPQGVIKQAQELMAGAVGAAQELYAYGRLQPGGAGHAVRGA